MTDDDKLKLADWLMHMQGNFECIASDPIVRDHISFLKRAEAWIRSSIPFHSEANHGKR